MRSELKFGMQQTWICLFLACASAMPAQTMVPGSTVLASARQDLAVDLQGRQLDFIRQNSRNLPFIEQIGLRTETDRFELRRQEYLARVNVNGIREMRDQRRFQQSDLAVENSRQRLYLHEALLERYRIMTGYYLTQRELALQQQLRAVYDDQVQVLQKMAALNAGAEVTDLIKAEYDRDALSLKMAESESRLEHFRQSIRLYVPGVTENWQLDTSDFIHPPEIEQVLVQLPQSVLQNPEVAEKSAEISRIDAEYALEQSQAQQMLDFFQFRHHNRPEEGFNRAFSVGFGINLPYKGSTRVKTSELKIEKNAAAQDLQLMLSELATQIESERRQIAALAQRYRLATQQWQDSQARYTLEQAGLARDAGPLPLLEAREGQLKRQFALLEMETKIFEHYLEILDRGGFLSDAPLVNYLSSSLTGF